MPANLTITARNAANVALKELQTQMTAATTAAVTGNEQMMKSAQTVAVVAKEQAMIVVQAATQQHEALRLLAAEYGAIARASVAGSVQQVEAIKLAEEAHARLGTVARATGKAQVDAGEEGVVAAGRVARAWNAARAAVLGTARASEVATGAGVAAGASGRHGRFTGSARAEEKGIARGFASSSGLGGWIAGPGFVLGALGGIEIKKAVSAVKTYQETIGQLRQAVTNLNEPWSKWQHQISASTDEMEKLGFAGNDTRVQLTNLIRVTGDVEKAQRQMRLAADISRGAHISLEAATATLIQADNGRFRGLQRLVGPIKQVTTYTDELKNAHIKVTDANRKEVVQLAHDAAAKDKSATAAGALAKAQAKFAGDAVRHSKSAEGATDHLRVAFEKLQIQMGTQLLPVLSEAAGGLSKWMSNAENVKALTGGVHDALKVLVGVFKAVKTIIHEVDNVTGSFKHTLELLIGLKVAKWAVDSATAIVTRLIPAEVAAGTAAEGAAGKAGLLRLRLLGLGGPEVIAALALVAGSMYTAYKWYKALTGGGETGTDQQPKEATGGYKAWTKATHYMGSGSNTIGTRIVDVPGVVGPFPDGTYFTVDADGNLSDKPVKPPAPGTWVQDPMNGKWFKMGKLHVREYNPTSGTWGKGRKETAHTTGGGAENLTASGVGGGFVPKGSRYVEGRTDHGRDFTTSPGGAIIAPGDGYVKDVGNDPHGFGPDYPVVYFSTGRYAGETIYIGHTHSALSKGAKFKEGDVIAHTGKKGVGSAHTPGWAEIGFGTPGTSSFGVSSGGKKAPPFGTDSKVTGDSSFEENLARQKAIGDATARKKKKHHTSAGSGGVSLHLDTKKLTKAQQDVAQTIYRLAIAHGFTPAQAIEVVVTAYNESNLDPGVMNHAGSGAHGLFQFLTPAYEKAFRYWRGQGYDVVTAETLAILIPTPGIKVPHTFQGEFAKNPDAAPGEVGLTTEGSQSNFKSHAAGVAFYRKGLGSTFSLSGSPQRGGTTGPAGLPDSGLTTAASSVKQYVNDAMNTLNDARDSLAQSAESLGSDFLDSAQLSIDTALQATIDDAQKHLETLREHLHVGMNASDLAQTRANITKWEHVLTDGIKKATDRASAAAQLASQHVANAQRDLEQTFQRAFDRQTKQHMDSFNRETAAYVKNFERETQRALEAMRVLVHLPGGQTFAFGSGVTETPSEKKLRELQEAQQKRQLSEQMQGAQAQLATANEGGDPQAIKDAQKLVDEAKLAQLEADLSKSAKTERDAADKQLQAAKDAYQQQRDAQLQAYQERRQDALDGYQVMRQDQWQKFQDTLADQKLLYAAGVKSWKSYVLDLQKALAALGVDIPDAIINNLLHLVGPGKYAGAHAREFVQGIDETYHPSGGSQKVSQTGRFATSPMTTLIGEHEPEAVIPWSWLPPDLRDPVAQMLRSRGVPGASKIPASSMIGRTYTSAGDTGGGWASGTASGGGGGTTVIVPITVNGHVTDVDSFAQEIRSKLLDVGRRQGGGTGAIFGGAA